MTPTDEQTVDGTRGLGDVTASRTPTPGRRVQDPHSFDTGS